MARAKKKTVKPNKDKSNKVKPNKVKAKSKVKVSKKVAPKKSLKKVEPKIKKVRKPKARSNPDEYNTWKEISYSKHKFTSGEPALSDTVEYIEVEGGRIYRNSLEMVGRVKRWLVFAPKK
jgi:hypothetical protein